MNTSPGDGSDRRPIQTRSKAWAKRMAAALAKRRITPNQISLASVVFALVGAGLLLWWPTPLGMVLCAITIQCRLLCNMFDGMVAVEWEQQSAVGALYNELPDRFADALFLVPLGFVLGQPWIGWVAALGAMLTAYLRAFGGTQGLAQDFCGPMAKPQRMAVLTLGLIVAAIESASNGTFYSLWMAAGLILLGLVWTSCRRTARIVRQLQAGGE